MSEETDSSRSVVNDVVAVDAREIDADADVDIDMNCEE